MSHGGKRPGSGRPKGGVNRATDEARKMAEATGVTPLQFMLDRMRDDAAPMEDRMDMAKAAAPYIHAKLSSIEANVNGQIDVRSWLNALS